MNEEGMTIKWTPVTERLPEFPKTSVWLNAKGEPSIPIGAKTIDDGPWSDRYIVCSDTGKVFFTTWYATSKKGKPYWTTRAKVVAWIPFPKPYKVDMVSVIRCKECKHLTTGEHGIWCEYQGIYTEEDNFCKWGTA